MNVFRVRILPQLTNRYVLDIDLVAVNEFQAISKAMEILESARPTLKFSDITISVNLDRELSK